MSRTIEREVTALSFDAREFKAGINQSLDDLDRLKGGLKMEGASRGLSNLERSSKRLSFNPLASSIQNVTARLSTMGIIGATIVNRLTNSVLDGVKRMVNGLVLTPLTTGLQEFELQMGAIQTILANTSSKGTVLEDVTDALDELNGYADRTIYNFGQMTDSVGKFTAAGVELDVSVAAIKGISNLAAISGSNAVQASTAMYQLSQAISTGSLKLQDWNSVVNAGLGGEIFQEALKETARVHGVGVDEIIEKNGSFRASLQEGWITTDILLDSLAKFTGDLNEEQLRSMGYTTEQIADIIKLGQTANDAATKIKTLSQLKDTVAEAMQSGWTETWRIIFGDFEEAKDLFGGIGEVLGQMVSTSADSRNRFFEVWRIRGGRDLAIQAVHDMFASVNNIISNFKEGLADVFEPLRGYDLYNVTRAIADFVERLRLASENGDRFKRIVRGLTSILDIVKMVVLAVLSPILGLSDSMANAGDSLIDWLANLGDSIYIFRTMAKETDFFGNIVKNVLSYLSDLGSRIGVFFTAFSNLEPVKDLTNYLSSITKSDVGSFFNGLLTILKTVGAAFYGVYLGIEWLVKGFLSLEPIQRILDSLNYENVKLFFAFIGDVLSNVVSKIKSFALSFSDVSTSMESFKNSLASSEAFKSFVSYINSFDGHRLSSFLNELRSPLEWLSGVFSKVTAYLSSFSNSTQDSSESVSNLGETLDSTLSRVFDYINNFEGTIDFTGVANVIFASLALAITTLAGKFATGGWLRNLFKGFEGSFAEIGKSLSGALGELEGVLTAYQNNLKADTLKQIAISIGIMAASVLALSLIEQAKLAGAVAAMAALLGELVGAMHLMSTISTLNVGKSAVAILSLSVSLLFLALAVKAFSTMSWDEIGRGLAASAGGILLLVGSVKLLGTSVGKDVIAASAAMGILSLSLIVLAKAIESMGAIDSEVAADGLLRIALGLAGFAAYARLVSGPSTVQASIAVGIMAASLELMSDAILSMSNMSWDSMGRGLAGIAGALLILALATKAMTGSLAGAAAILIVSVAMLALASAISTISLVSWEGIGKALAALAGILLIFGLAGLLLGPVVPILLGLGASLALIGLGALALGAGLVLGAAGLLLLAGSATAIAAAIGVVGGAITVVLPTIATALALALVNLLTTLAEHGSEMFEAGKTLILTILDAIVEVAPEIVEGLLGMLGEFLETLAENIPDFVQSGYDILLGILEGIEENIQEVVETGLNIAVEFINGLTEGIPELVIAANEFVAAFVGAVIESFGTNAESMIETALTVGGDVVQGLADGIAEGLDKVVGAATELGRAALQAFLDIFQINSPAETTEKIGGHVGGGLILGIKNSISGVVKAATEMVKKAQNGMKLVTKGISKAITDDLDVSPVVTPVLDLSDFNQGLRSLNGRLSGNTKAYGISGAIQVQQKSIGRAESEIIGKHTDNTGGIQYNQYNYSPKALSTLDIYQKTRSQVAKLEHRGLSS